MPGSRKVARAERLSLRGLAARLGVSHPAVRKAIAAGRLRASVGREKGVPFIRDAALAAREWAAGASKPSPAPLQVAPSASPTSRRKAPEAPAGGTLNDAQRRVALQREAALRIANRQRRGQLVVAEVVRREAFQCARAVRDAVLNIPDRVAAELAAESDTATVHARLEGEIRQALEVLAEHLAHGE